MMTGTVPTINGGTLRIDQAAHAAVAGMGNVFADPIIVGQRACSEQLTTLLVDVYETLEAGGRMTPHDVRIRARELAKALKPHLYDADLWGSTETSTEAIRRRVEKAVAAAIRLVVLEFEAKAVIPHEC